MDSNVIFQWWHNNGGECVCWCSHWCLDKLPAGCAERISWQSTICHHLAIIWDVGPKCSENSDWILLHSCNTCTLQVSFICNSVRVIASQLSRTAAITKQHPEPTEDYSGTELQVHHICFAWLQYTLSFAQCVQAHGHRATYILHRNIVYVLCCFDTLFLSQSFVLTLLVGCLAATGSAYVVTSVGW